MKISYNWLKDFVDIDVEPLKLAEVLTNTGLEVEGIEHFEAIKGGLKGLVIGEVLTCKKHPNADKLSLTTVSIGEAEPLNIVCGAPNVAAGQKVVVAPIGTKLHSGGECFEIKKTKIRGELSEGMICAEDEIGLGENHDGIMVLEDSARAGTEAADYFEVYRDTVFEIGLTPNRIDAASHFGTARDIAAYFNLINSNVTVNPVKHSEVQPDNNDLPFKITIEKSDACRRFTGLTISNLDIQPSPKWLQNRLKAIGLSPINNVVDTTNYVLHEMGQPLHAYDVDKLNDKEIVVRCLDKGTRFVTLDGVQRELSDNDLMVCDGKEPHCIAGVFGGEHSGVTASTKRIFLESAYFDPVYVRKTAKRHGLSTDSSFRFERGVDPENTLIALKRAAALIKEIAGGVISSEIMDVHPNPIVPVEIEVKYSHIHRLIGKKLDADLIKKILISLDIKIISENGDSLQVKVPPYRVDVTREADIIEEILRIYGYNNVAFSNKLRSSISYQDHPYNEQLVNTASDFLSAVGFTEIMANSLTKSDYYSNLKTYPVNRLVPILNPLSTDLNVMRQTLLFGGLETIARNINHKNPNLRLYEYGRVYELLNTNLADYNSFNETPVIGMFLTGLTEEQSWSQPETEVTFFHLKAYYINLLKNMGIAMQQFKTGSLENCTDIFEGGIAYTINRKEVIRAGQVNIKLCEQFDIEQPVYYAEILWSDLVPRMSNKKKFKELPKYPEVRRDLALLIDEQITYEQIENIARKNTRELLTRIELFDYFKGKSIPDGKKSYAVSFYLQDKNKTLTDKEIDKTLGKITQALQKELNAELR